MSKSILIVDDEPNIVICLEYLFKREGFQVNVAGDGVEALRKIAENAPDLVLLDIMMPLKNGYEVCQEIRAHPDWRSLKIIMLSAKGRDTEIQKGLALGADAYLTKPFATKELVAKVKELLVPVVAQGATQGTCASEAVLVPVVAQGATEGNCASEAGAG